jgi:hypothetical protein
VTAGARLELAAKSSAAPERVPALNSRSQLPRSTSLERLPGRRATYGTKNAGRIPALCHATVYGCSYGADFFHHLRELIRVE